MKRLLCLIVGAGLLWFLFAPQWRSYERMGERRTLALRQPGKELLVGVCWPFEDNQDGFWHGVELARDEINAGRLTGGPSIRLVVRDSGSEWRSESLAIEFANTPDMSAVIGYYEDGAAKKAAPIYEASRLLHIMAWVNATSITTTGDPYLIRPIVSSDKIARSIAQMTFEGGAKTFAVIAEETAYGADLAYQFRVAMDSLGGQLVYSASYIPEQADFRLMVNQLKRVKADMVFFAGLEPWAGDFLRLGRAVGLKVPILGAFCVTPEMLKRAGSAMEGARYFDFYDPRRKTPENLAFVQKFRQRYGQDPDAVAAQGYDSLHLLARAARSTASRDGLDLCYGIRFSEAWEGANGSYRFDHQGEMDDKPIYLMEYRHGAPVILREGPLVAPPLLR